MDKIEKELQKLIKKINDSDKHEQEQKTLKFCSIEIYEVSKDYDSKKVIESIKDYCASHNCKYAIMLHNNDFYTKDTFDSDFRLIGHKGDKKANHYHCLIAFKNRVGLNDIAIAFGVEDRWIKILKHDYDFDNMVVYLTHIKYDPLVKTHYSPTLFDSNIQDYCSYLYDQVVSDMESEQNNICTFVIAYLHTLEKKCTYESLIMAIFQGGYGLNEYNKYYRVIKDLLIEHNQNFDSEVNAEKTTDMIQMLQGQLADVQHNLDVVLDENMKLRGIGDEKKERLFE